MSWFYFIEHKSEVYDAFVKFHKMILTQFQKQIRILQSDNGGEYVNHRMQNYLPQNGLIHQTSYPNTPKKMELQKRKTELS